MVHGERFRITVLTADLVRFEYSPSGVFEDRPTQAVLNRDFPTPEFRVTRDGHAVQVLTDSFQLNYDGGVPTSTGLSVKTFDNYHGVWRPGQPPQSRFSELAGVPVNLGGTARTLDGIDGATPVEPGMLSSLGPTLLDDSASLALDADGWVAPREPDVMDVYLFCHGRRFREAMRDWYHLTGPQPMLPRFALGNWWSRYHPYTQLEYQALVERFEGHDLPFSVAVVDMDWHLVDIPERFGHGWTGYTWNDELFPDHVGFLRWLHEHGLKVSLNVHPADGVRAFEAAYPEMATAMGIDPASELPVNFDIGNPDFLMPYLEILHHRLEDEGVDFWWLDWQQGTHSSTPGLDPLWALNHFHFLDAARSGRRPLTFSRYAGPGSHRYPVGFSGDTVISWDSLDFQPWFTATASNIGYGWWSHDIGGHMMGVKDDELATRWVQFGVFSPINRLHASNSVFNGKEPWRFNEVAERVQGEFLRFRHRMVPYLHTMNERAHRLAEPLVRPVYWDAVDPSPERFRHSNQYWFGTELLVAPVTRPADPELKIATSEGWLPPGTWVDVFTGLVYAGDRHVTFHRRLDEYPVLARGGAIVPLTASDTLRADRNPDALEIRLYAGASGEFELYEDDDAVDARVARTRMVLDADAGTFTIEPARGDLSVVPPVRDITVVLTGARQLTVEGHDTSWDAATGVLTVALGAVSSDRGTTVRFSGPIEVHDNQLGRRVFAWLDRAEMAFEAKETAWAAVDADGSPARIMARLDQLDLPPLARGALAEMVLALS